MSANCRELVLQVSNQAKRAAVHVLRGSCLLALLASVAGAETVRLYWDPNSETDLAGYVLVWGNSSRIYTESVTLPKTAVSHDLTYSCVPGTQTYYALRAFDLAGRQSGYSNEVAVTCGTTVPVKLVPRSLGNVVVVIVTRG
jgi:hypothetical protein